MKKVLKITGLSLMGIVLLLGMTIAFLAFKPTKIYDDIPLPELSIRPDSAMIDHGQKLVMMNCAGCHEGESDNKLTGKLFPDRDSRALGMIYSPNITQHPEHGAGKYTEAELYRLLRTGVKRNNELALPLMGGMSMMTEDDIHAMIAFLKSDRPAVQPVPVSQPAFEPTLLYRLLSALLFKPTPYPETLTVEPSTHDPVEYGRFLVQARYYCYACHSTGMDKADYLVPENTPGYLAGGAAFNVELPDESYSIVAPSLIQGGETATWTEDQFIAALKWGQRPSGLPYKVPMHPYTMIDSTEARAIFQYLRSYHPPAESR